MRRNNGSILNKIEDEIVEVKVIAFICFEINGVFAFVKVYGLKIVNLEVIPTIRPVGEGIEGVSKGNVNSVNLYNKVSATPTGYKCDTDIRIGSLFYIKFVCNVGVTVLPVTDNLTTGCSGLIEYESLLEVTGSTVRSYSLNLKLVTVGDGGNGLDRLGEVYDKVVKIEV